MTGTPGQAAETGVVFYVLREPSERAVDTLTCKVVETAWRRGLKVLIVGRDVEHCGLLDDLLWTFSQGSFIPHAVGDDPDVPVRIAESVSPARERCDVIVSRHPDPVAESFHHLRIADIIGASEAERQQARRRFRYYRDHGFAPETHHL